MQTSRVSFTPPRRQKPSSLSFSRWGLAGWWAAPLHAWQAILLFSDRSDHPPREEKTEQLVDTRHEVDQLVLELQKVKQEVSKEVCACQEGRVAGTPQ